MAHLKASLHDALHIIGALKILTIADGINCNTLRPFPALEVPCLNNNGSHSALGYKVKDEAASLWM